MEDRFWGFHLDFVGFIASFLCAIHCAAIPFVLTFSIWGGMSWISDPIFELGFLVASITIAGFTLWNGYIKETIDKRSMILFLSGFALLFISRALPHTHGVELIFAITGGLTVATGHVFHWMALRRRGCMRSYSTGNN
ncbi:MAG: MerC domain-containing protein [Saprospiraceae bacterium]|nr:MerC domain-containing protein [Saprospiraceae bacterium]